MSERERFNRVDQLFRAARAVAADDQAAFLEQECADDESLKRDVLDLLAQDEATSGVLDRPAMGDGFRINELGPLPGGPEALPEKIGRYRIVRRIGAGGMGVVYEAEQDAPRRTVALKIINAGVASPVALRRFEHEAQVLGRLQHPGIAQIIEAGTFDAGGGVQPFFAMEFIQGQPITDHAREHALGARERLELMTRVCDAVHHAHQRGVIHRDIKPANILVDASGQPKILDFGIARATDGDIRTTTLRTDIGQLIGTIPYMSPEQAAGDPGDLDIRSDVYALGVVSYEMLADRLPYDLREKLLHEAVRVIREDEPMPLSSVNRTLGGDVETIISKALEKDKTRRYDSASALADDFRRYLNHEPVAARRPSMWYQVRKFTRRNKLLVGSAAAIVFMLVAAVIVSAIFGLGQMRAREREGLARAEAQAQADIASAVNGFLATDLLQSVDPELGSRTITMLEALDNAAASIGERFRSKPRVEAAIRTTLGTTYANLGALDEAQEQFEEALRLREASLAPDDPDLTAARHNLGVTHYRQGRYDDAEQAYLDVLDARRRVLGERHILTIAVVNDLALLHKETGRYEEAREGFERALAAQIEVTGREHRDALAILTNLADVHSNLEEFEAAEGLFTEALEGRRREHGETHPRTLTTRDGFAQLRQRQGRLEEASDLFGRVASVRLEVLGADHPDTMAVLARAAVLDRELGRTDEAIEGMTRLLEARRSTLGATHPHVLESMHDLGNVYLTAGRLEEADEMLTASLAGRREALGDDHPATAVSMNNLALVRSRQDRPGDAIELYEEALPVLRGTFGEDHSNTLSTMQNLATLYSQTGRLEESEVLFRQLIALMRDAGMEESRSFLLALNNLGHAYTRLERYEEAEPLLAEALAVQRATVEANHPQTFSFMYNLSDVYYKQGKLEEAVALLEELTAGVREALPADHPAVASTIVQLVRVRMDQELYEQSEPLLREALAAQSARFGDAHSATLQTRILLGRCLTQLDRLEEAEAELLASYEAIEDETAEPHRRQAVVLLVTLYERWGRADEAVAWRERSVVD